MQMQVALIAEFFSNLDYDLGYSDVARQSGLTDPDATPADMLRGLHYLAGYCDAAAAANAVLDSVHGVYGAKRANLIARAIGVTAKLMAVYLDDGDRSPRGIERLVDTFTIEVSA